MAKINNRKAVAQAQHQNHMGGPGPTGPSGLPSSGGLGPPGMKAGMGMAPQLHHHHAHPDGSGVDGNAAGMFHHLPDRQ